MNKKTLKQLVLSSYTKGKLDPKLVSSIADKLNRNMVKLYIKGLKNQEKQTSVFIDMPFPPKESDRKTFKKLFPRKKIIYTVDPSLLLGIKITDNDMVHQANVKNTLYTILETMEEEEYD